jgi:hypothetical protein
MNKKVAIGIGVGALVLIGGGYFLYSQRQKAQELAGGAGGTGAGSDPLGGTDVTGGQKMASAPAIDEGSTAGGASASTSTGGIQIGDNWKDSKGEVVGKWRESKTDIKAVCGRRPLFGKAKKQAWAECVAQYSGFAGFSGFDGGGCHMEVGEMLNDL